MNGKGGHDWTSLHYACLNGYRHIAELLLDHGADIDARTSSNAIPLMKACMRDYASTTKLLLEHGLKVNDFDKYGATPFYNATWCIGTRI